ncbi:hypothetical protein [Actinophytocola sp.]|uniref:hypothetical protein n=1 Tax=Actinophytocola sp. TaxID=1872138 RepID=UPI002D80F255|nr:hypothetical protein [Actinophytocola sp.]HET9143789.1 hypothetical protein [Actinophytocola sp.]
MGRAGLRGLAGVAVLGLVVIAPVPAGAATVADRIASAGANWREVLAVELKALPDNKVSVAGQLSGQVLGGTVTLPATITLRGDTTIVARELVFTGAGLRVEANGHALALYPVTATRRAGAGTQGVTVIDTSAHDAPSGAPGFPGQYGYSGYPGSRGQDGWDPFFCAGTEGGQGGSGDSGGPGGTGSPGEQANSGGDLTLDIPDGSTESYQLISRGGRGGDGGSGGEGGSGGSGGSGGNGGDQYFYCYTGQWPGAAGGNGGTGASGGTGGAGGNGGSGGSAGAIQVTYPAGYNPGWISYDSSGGAGGNGGSGGHAGLPGSGGWGGFGGFGYPYGPNGQPGYGGYFGSSGNPGYSGSAGGSGAVSITQR